MNEERIKEFITLALGDVAEPRAFSVGKLKGGEFYVSLTYPGLVYVSNNELRQEWKQAQEDNSEFKDIKLYLPA